MPYILTRHFSHRDGQRHDISIDLSPAGGFWVVHCALTRVQTIRPNETHHAAVGILNAVMPNPPLFEVTPEDWHPTLFGNGISRVIVGILAKNCSISACLTAQRWD